MSPRILQDIVPQKGPQKEIKEPEVVVLTPKVPETPDIFPENIEKVKIEEEEIAIKIPEEEKVIDYSDFRNEDKKNFPWKLLIIILIGIIFVGGIVLAVNKYFSYAHIYITPKTLTYTFEKESFTARKDDNASLHFEIMIVEGEDKQSAVFTETKDLNSKATGTVVIYNAFSTKPQKLTINTRLSDDKKHIYMTDKEVMIPGYTGAGAKIVPGSVEVSVTASASGPAYNGDPRDFSIVGFAGTAKASKIYARSKTPLSGGEVGTFYVLSAQDKGKAIVDGGTALYNKLVKKLQAQVPPGYIVYPGSMQYNKKTTDDTFQSKTPDGTITITGTLSAPIFKESEMREAIVRNLYPEVEALELSEISSPKMQNFTFAYTDTATQITKTTDIVKFTFTGSDTLLWNPMMDVLKTKLVGVDKDSLDTIFTTDPGIAKARAKFTPPWQGSVPTDTGHINITLE